MSNVERTVDLAPRPGSVAEARRIVTKVLRDLDPSARDIGVLLASELVTNALLYASGRICLRITEEPGCYRIAVADESAAPVEPRHLGLEATSGRGLALVERLSQAWGVDVHEPDGKEVWFELRRQP